MRSWASAALCILLCGATLAGAQTLAHRNWAGSGITIEPWYQSALFYQIDPLTFQDSNGDGFGDLAGICARLPYLEQLGVDALVLSPLPLDPPGGGSPFDPTYGTAEDFDNLERDANARHIRLLVDLSVDLPHEQLLATARFWLGRGVAGLRLTGPMQLRAEVIRELRPIAGATRILLGEPDPNTDPAPPLASRNPAPRALPEITFDRRLALSQTLTPSLLRSVLLGSNLLSDSPNVARSIARLGDGTHDLALARIVATALLLGRGAPLLYFGQELGMAGTGDSTPMQWGGGAQGFTTATPWIMESANAGTANARLEDVEPGSLLNWYRTLARVRHAEAAVRTGTLEMLPTRNPNVIAWLRRPRAGKAPAVLVIVNFSPYATRTPLSSLLPARSETLRLLAKSSPDSASNASGEAIALEAYGTYVAELSSGGLENVVLPQCAHRRR